MDRTRPLLVIAPILHPGPPNPNGNRLPPLNEAFPFEDHEFRDQQRSHNEAFPFEDQEFRDQQRSQNHRRSIQSNSSSDAMVDPTVTPPETPQASTAAAAANNQDQTLIAPHATQSLPSNFDGGLPIRSEPLDITQTSGSRPRTRRPVNTTRAGVPLPPIEILPSDDHAAVKRKKNTRCARRYRANRFNETENLEAQNAMLEAKCATWERDYAALEQRCLSLQEKCASLESDLAKIRHDEERIRNESTAWNEDREDSTGHRGSPHSSAHSSATRET